MLEDRNKLSHMYSEKVFDEVNKSIKKYLNTLLAVTLVLKEKK
jgi:hypothetical protein